MSTVLESVGTTRYETQAKGVSQLSLDAAWLLVTLPVENTRRKQHQGGHHWCTSCLQALDGLSLMFECLCSAASSAALWSRGVEGGASPSSWRIPVEGAASPSRADISWSCLAYPWLALPLCPAIFGHACVCVRVCICRVLMLVGCLSFCVLCFCVLCLCVCAFVCL